MIHELMVFLQRMLGLLLVLLLGILVGGIWVMLGTIMLPAVPSAVSQLLPTPDAVDRALEAESDFVLSWPGQTTVVRWWGWSAIPAEPSGEMVPSVERADTFSKMTKGLERPVAKMSAQLVPWLHLIWIRSVAVLGIVAAALLPALAWWLAGRRRAYELHLDGATPSDGQRKTWLAIAHVLALVPGVLIGAPIAVAMGPWIALSLLCALATLYPLRSSMAAQI